MIYRTIPLTIIPTRSLIKNSYQISLLNSTWYRNLSYLTPRWNQTDTFSPKVNNQSSSSDSILKLESKFKLITHLQPYETWLQTLPFLLKVQHSKGFNTVPKVSQVWYTPHDPRIIGIKPFLPNKFEDPTYLRLETLWVYRKLLRESLRFFDLRARDYLINRIKTEYRQCQGPEFQKQIPEIRSQARKFSRLIARANRYDRAAVTKILEYTYARCYKLRWELLKPYLPSSEVLSEKYRSWLPLQIPLQPMIASLVKFHDLKTKPACPKHVEHSPVRLFNHYRQHTNRILSKIQPPLPQYLFNELELKSDIKFHILNCKSYPLDPRPTPKITIPPKEFIKLSEDTIIPAPPDSTKLRRLARLYQKLLLKIPLQFSGPDFFNPETIIKNEGILFNLSKWAGRSPKPFVSELDRCPIGEGVNFLDQP